VASALDEELDPCLACLAFPLAHQARLRTTNGLEGIEVVRTPYRAPKASAIAERWVGSVRRECLDHLLMVNAAHLRRVLAAYVAHYNQARPHQGLEQRTLLPTSEQAGGGPVRRRERLGGLLREYYREAA
jgi:putative transposase